jgi:hypothetical protein
VQISTHGEPQTIQAQGEGDGGQQTAGSFTS